MAAAPFMNDPLTGSPSFQRAMAARKAREARPSAVRQQPRRAPSPRLRELQRWSAPINIRAATQGLCIDGYRLDLAGMDTRGCTTELYWRHRDGHAGRAFEVIGRVDELSEARWGRDYADLSLQARIRLDLTTDEGRQQWERHQRGEALAASIMFLRNSPPESMGGWVRDWQLRHVSLVEPGKQVDPRAVTPRWAL
ncbi:hypothetical protein [Micromonospora carbonacea]|uniref:Uncharacterized protein n=1 Tax=Micromonospora carbonacea TaxID=47853 RepID=A0A7H8XIG7_9ACTN|nr:hypothetical protein [Micromonospora carbonacea]MBB5828146.1 hypothetical protein [Micromonospora carbonacea]QLD24209.1 hypothetical protein HXZ27_08260 [Micromonospora carbonacea]